MASQRYLPRRRAATTRDPTRRAAKSTGPPVWRRTERGCATSTASIRRPTTKRSSPRRTTSTSGSSGIAHPVGGPGVELLLDDLPRGLGRLLLGLLLAPSHALAIDRVGNPHAGDERLRVVRAALPDQVL